MIKPLEAYALSKVIIAAIATIVFAYWALLWPYGNEYLVLTVAARIVSGLFAFGLLVYVYLAFDEFIHDKYGR